MTDLPPGPPSGGLPPSGGYPPPAGYPPPGGYYPPPGGYYPPPGGYPPYPVAALPREAYTSWFTRVLAWIIDMLPAALLSGIGQGILFATADNECVTDTSDGYRALCTSQPSGPGLTAAALFGLASLGYVLWNYGYRQGTTGSSIGKSVLKFKVVGERTGQPIGFGLSVVRQLAHLVDALICYVGYLFPLWDAKRQTLADKIMTTVCLPR